MGFFQKTRDRLIEKTAPRVLNETLMREYGQITSLEIDSRDKSLHVEVLLRGEKEPIRVEIQRYEISTLNERPCFIARKINTSREWITTLANNELIGRPIPLPSQLSGLITRLL
jgi:hypothetical protein